MKMDKKEELQLRKQAIHYWMDLKIANPLKAGKKPSTYMMKKFKAFERELNEINYQLTMIDNHESKMRDELTVKE